jgi:hypothetical protein
VELRWMRPWESRTQLVHFSEEVCLGRWLPDGQGGAQSSRRWPNSLMRFSAADFAGPTIVVRARHELSANLSRVFMTAISAENRLISIFFTDFKEKASSHALSSSVKCGGPTAYPRRCTRVRGKPCFGGRISRVSYRSA